MIGPNPYVVPGAWGYVTRFEIIPAPPAPKLALGRSGGGALLRWSTNAVGFVLESTGTLLATNQWTAVTNVPVVVDANNVVTNTLSGTSHFYRLRFVLDP